MPTPNPFFLFPFGTSGDDTVVPNTGASTGTMSYQYGFTPNYEADLLTDPAAIPVPRAQMNQLFFDITTALQIIQTQGLPTWVAAGSGGPTNYPKGAMVNYSGLNYISMVASNASTPGTDNNWLQLGTQLTTNVPSPGVSLSTSVVNVASLVLPPGLWRVDGNVVSSYSAGSGALQYGVTCWLSPTGAASAPADPSDLASITFIPIGGTSGSTVPPIFVDTTSGTTVYLNAQGFFTGGTVQGCGNIQATLLNAP